MHLLQDLIGVHEIAALSWSFVSRQKDEIKINIEILLYMVISPSTSKLYPAIHYLLIFYKRQQVLKKPEKSGFSLSFLI
jgi:hypothetical protein